MFRECERRMRKTTQLARLLRQPGLDFILEAHNALSAQLVERAGFEGIWASGLAISAAAGVRDSNEISWTQVLDVVEFMCDATTIPVLVDGDTGFGDFNNVRRLVTKLEQRGAAGVCLEDKLFPKTNSFIEGQPQPLADADEFAGKIRAATDTRSDEHFCIIARTETLIAGRSMDEALDRAGRYAEAGADAILIHSKRETADEVLEFKRRWTNARPVVIVPTTYHRTPTARLRDAGFSLVIWANHMVRAATAVMEEVARTIRREASVGGIDRRIAPVSKLFELQNVDELARAKQQYLPHPTAPHTPPRDRP